jgi:hypothetical protein
MDPGATSGLPTSFFINPIFTAAFGAAAAVGLILVGLTYLIVMKIKNKPPEKCSTCGMTADQLQNFACQAHGELSVRVKNLEDRMKDQREETNKAHERIDKLMEGKGYGR